MTTLPTVRKFAGATTAEAWAAGATAVLSAQAPTTARVLKAKKAFA
jgi:hypothetical protein